MVKKRQIARKKKRKSPRKKKRVEMTTIKFRLTEPTASEKAARTLRKQPVRCVAEIELDTDERSSLLATAKELLERAEALRKYSPRIPNTPPLGFRVYMIGNRAVTVHTLSQML